MIDKLEPTHLERTAIVYVRQSSLQQVRDHSEGRARQYALAERAKALGFSTVETIDEDLGRSGSGLVERPGFGRLLNLVCDGRVGAVLAFEASRLARNNRDWHHLIDLCTLTNTLVMDLDGVYDPRKVNDRLLLGLKGNMSEFELGLLRQRARAAIDAMTARGAVIHAVPIGYMRTDDQRCELDPNVEIQAAIRRVFGKFRELGTARQVLLWHREEQVALPSRSRGSYGDLRWELPTYSRVLQILTNPTYAGAYVRGRTRTTTKMVDGRARRVTERIRNPKDWQVLLKDRHVGYIEWEEFMSNQDRLSSNLAGSIETGTGAPKSGAALLAGLLRCSQCGRKRLVRYGGTSGTTVRYECRARKQEQGAKGCFTLGGIKLERAIVDQVLNALSQEGVSAAVKAAETAQAQSDERAAAMALAVERARYEQSRRRRQYDAVDPDNRLVAQELERRWESALDATRAAEERLTTARQSTSELTKDELGRLEALGANLPALWKATRGAVALQKRVLRAVINEIMVDKRDHEVDVRIHWMGGAHTRVSVEHNKAGSTRRSIPKDTIQLIRDFCALKPDRYVATVLNHLEVLRPDGSRWTRAGVCDVRHTHGIPCFDQEREVHVVSLSGAAVRLGIDRFAVKRMIDRGLIPAQRFGSRIPTIIKVSDLAAAHVREAVLARNSGQGPTESPSGQDLLPFSDLN